MLRSRRTWAFVALACLLLGVVPVLYEQGKRGGGDLGFPFAFSRYVARPESAGYRELVPLGLAGNVVVYVSVGIVLALLFPSPSSAGSALLGPKPLPRALASPKTWLLFALVSVVLGVVPALYQAAQPGRDIGFPFTFLIHFPPDETARFYPVRLVVNVFVYYAVGVACTLGAFALESRRSRT